MDKTRRRILDTLARTLGQTHSIRGLVDEIEQLHGTAHYPNVHDELHELAEEGIVSFDEAGRSKVPRLSLANPRFPDAMAKLELWRKDKLLDETSQKANAILHVEEDLADEADVLTLGLVDAERNLTLRRLEPLVLVRTDADRKEEGAVHRLTGRLEELASDTALRVDPLVLSQETFLQLLQAGEANPIPRLLRNQTCMLDPQRFWRGIQISLGSWASLASATPARLGEIPGDTVAWNLARFGYTEHGRDLDGRGTAVCPEAVIVAALGSDAARWIGAAGVVLSKADHEPPLLAYVARAEDEAKRLLGVLHALGGPDTSERTAETVDLLEASGVEPEEIETDLVQEALELYG